jgi:hypothetical protein
MTMNSLRIDNQAVRSLIGDLVEKPSDLSTSARYTVLNGTIYLAAGVLLIFWPGVMQTVLRERAFVGCEQGLISVVGLTVLVIDWLYFFSGLGGGRRIVAASVIDRLIFVPLVLLPLAIAGVFPHLLILFTALDMGLAVGAWVLLGREPTK